MYVVFLRTTKGEWVSINLSDRRKAERLVRDITEGDKNYVFGYLYDPEAEYQQNKKEGR